MRVLVLAPQPFFQERGTPIDVLLVLRVLSESMETDVDALVYHEGADVDLQKVRLHRISVPRWIRGVRPGFSFKKLWCDLAMFRKAWRMVRTGNYDVIHAGEESVFMAVFFKRLFGVPYVYDLDSSVAQQLVERHPVLRLVSPLFDWLETLAIRGSLGTLPVCNALGDLCERKGSRKNVILHDISQLKDPQRPKTGALNKELGTNRLLVLYAGNLEAYQGIDLLLESFRRVCRECDSLDLVVIGGVPADISRYRGLAEQWGLAGRAHFLGPRPFGQLDYYLAEADILACPRIRGINTPMKIFPYLHSGRPLIATDLPTHNQLLTRQIAYLAPATPDGFAAGLIALASRPELREQLGREGQAFIERNHTYEAHVRRLRSLYDWVEKQIGSGNGKAVGQPVSEAKSN